MELLWLREKFGNELIEELDQDYCEAILIRKPHPTLPDDIFKETHLYVNVDDSSKKGLLFALKYGLSKAQDPRTNECK